MKQGGKVWLAGAGPGDAGLLTVKTKELLKNADVIVYDALVSTEILCQIPAGKEMIFVGKRAGNHPVPQEEINQILLTEAKKGNQILRLKGGDPFVFGRGGEELELLVQENVPFEIIPGITSAAAVPAYAGIPLTHRDYVSSFHVVTGHPRKDGTSRIDYPALVKMKGTLVFLMGLSLLETICQGLQDAGMSSDTPAAVLERGTSARQRRVVSDIGHLAEQVRAENISAPALIIVGEVCALEQNFQWAEKRVLGGRQFLITRPRQQVSVLAERLRELGAQVLEVPAIQTIPIRPNRKLVERMQNFACREGEAWLVFTSPAGVQIFFEEMMEEGMDVRRIFAKKAEVKLAVIGSATQKALKMYGLLADLMPATYDSISLGKLLAQTVMPNSEIVVVRAAEGSEELLPPLYNAGLDVTDVALYETEMTQHRWLRERIIQDWKMGEVDAAVFTSASTVRGFAQEFLYERENFAGLESSAKSGLSTATGILPETVTAVCIGTQTAKEAAKYGMRTVVSDEASIDSLVKRICIEYGNK